MTTSHVWLQVNRVTATVCQQALAVSVADIHEAMSVGSPAPGLMSSRMRPLVRTHHAAGPAVTARCSAGDNLMMHRALSLAQRGDVLVVVCEDELSGAQWGDIAAQYAMTVGLAGVVVQGCIRDVVTLERMSFPVWSTAISPVHPEKRGHGTVNAPVECAGAAVHPGDLVVGDGDGVVVIPRADAASVIDRAIARARREDELAAAIRAGAAPWDLAGLAQHYAAIDVQEIDAAWA